MGRGQGAGAGGSKGSEPEGRSRPPKGTVVEPIRKRFLELDEDSAAQHVTEIARSVPMSERFGEDKVFVSDAFQRAKAQDPTLTEEQFKRGLLHLHRQDKITLSRADLVEAMDPKKVASSEINYLGATFNFITLGAARKKKR